jgi:hypothetical protein
MTSVAMLLKEAKMINNDYLMFDYVFRDVDFKECLVVYFRAETLGEVESIPTSTGWNGDDKSIAKLQSQRQTCKIN